MFCLCLFVRSSLSNSYEEILMKFLECDAKTTIDQIFGYIRIQEVFKGVFN